MYHNKEMVVGYKYDVKGSLLLLQLVQINALP